MQLGKCCVGDDFLSDCVVIEKGLAGSKVHKSFPENVVMHAGGWFLVGEGDGAKCEGNVRLSGLGGSSSLHYSSR